ncbi:MAG: hypothetical protein OWV35_08345 [Firmicutes bacterium]|nr:hypothetical protein [Bacillota bacterium]
MLGAGFLIYIAVASWVTGLAALALAARVDPGLGEGPRWVLGPAAAGAPLAALLLLAGAATGTLPGARAAALRAAAPPLLLTLLAAGVRRRPAAVLVLEALGMLVADHAAESALWLRPLPLPGPRLAAGPWPATGWFLLHQLLAGLSVAGLLLAAAGFLAPARPGGRAEGGRALLWGVLALVPQPLVGYRYCETLLRYYTPAWARLMGGAVRHLWFDASFGVTALFTGALAAVAAVYLRPPSRPLAVRLLTAVCLLLAGAGIAWLLREGGRIMVPAFTRTMAVAALTGLAAGLAAAAFSVRGLVTGLAGLALVVMGLMGWSWVAADAPLAWANGWIRRPPAPPVSVGAGYRVALDAGCFTCHGDGGGSQWPNPGDPAQYVPAWDSPAFAGVFDSRGGRQRLWTVLWDGQYAYRQRYYPHGGNWSVAYHTVDNAYVVPAWAGVLSRRDLQSLIAYIQSLAPPAAGGGRKG